MKKQLLFGVTAFASLAVIAQNSHRTIANAKFKKMETMNFTVAEPSIFNITPSTNVANKVSAAPYKRIAGSTNALGTIVSESRCLQYNEALNTVGLVYRQNINLWTGIPDGNSGTISYVWSSNNGSSWDSTVVLASSTQFHRYPCGTIYNPLGNTTPSNALAVASGPWHPGANWQGVYFGSKQLQAPGTTSVNPALYIDNLALTAGQAKQDFSRVDPQTTADGVVHIVGQMYGDANGTTAAAQQWRGSIINKGVFNAGSFTWTVDSLKPDFKLDNAGDKSGYTGTANMAWNQAGTIGYVIFYGVDANAVAGTSQNSFQPYVYKTTNSGTSWSRFAPLFDFTTIPVINDRLFGVHNTNLVKPFIAPGEGASATVDANGDLHLFTSLSSAFSDDLDSLGFTYSPNYNQVWNYLMDFKTTSTGWDAMIVDSLSNAGPTAAESNWTGATNISYDARCQISRTTDGNHLIYSWADSDSSSVTTHISTLPDVFMRGYDVAANKMTCKKNMTTGKASIASQAYFFFTSPIIAKPTSSSLLIPMTVVRSDDGTNNGDVAISQYYIDDNLFATSEFTVTPNGQGCSASSGVGINELASTVSNLNFYPNPASSNGTIEVSLVENAKMDIVVMNSVGQTVYTTSFDGTSGSNKVDINLSNLSAGLYFYQVKMANSKSVTKKFVVQK